MSIAMRVWVRWFFISFMFTISAVYLFLAFFPGVLPDFTMPLSDLVLVENGFLVIPPFIDLQPKAVVPFTLFSTILFGVLSVCTFPLLRLTNEKHALPNL